MSDTQRESQGAEPAERSADRHAVMDAHGHGPRSRRSTPLFTAHMMQLIHEELTPEATAPIGPPPPTEELGRDPVDTIIPVSYTI